MSAVGIGLLRAISSFSRVLLSALLLVGGCGDKEAIPPPQARSVEAAPSSTRQLGESALAAQTPLLLAGKLRITLLAAANADMHPQFVVQALLFPGALAFDAKGTLYAVASRNIPDFPDASHNDDLIVAIAPDGTSRVVAESGLMGYAETDDHRRSPEYNGFSGLQQGPAGSLLSMLNGAYPVTIDGKGSLSFIPFTIPPAGPVIKTFQDLDASNFPDYLKWQFSSIQPLPDGQVALAVGKPEVWYRARSGATLTKINRPEDLPIAARLDNKNDGTVLGPDGYLYGIEKAKTPQEPDHLVRVGDPGKSSLRPDATQVRVADLAFRDATGELAIGPQGQVAFSAETGIYVVQRLK